MNSLEVKLVPKQAKSKKNNKKSKKKIPILANTSMVISKPKVKAGLDSGVVNVLKQNTVMKICALTDPFCGHANGVAYPDGMVGLVPFTVRGHYAIGTHAAGESFTIVTTAFPYNILHSTSIAAGVFTLEAAQVGVNTGGLTNYFGSYRPVNCGFILRNLSNVANTSGYVIVRRIAYADQAPGSTVSEGNCFGIDVYTFPIAPGMEIPFVFQPMTGPEAYDLIIPSITTAQSSSITYTAWDTFTIETVGAVDSTLALDLECYFHYQGQLKATYAPLSGLTNNSVKQADSKLAETANVVRSKLTSTFIETATLLGQKAIMAAGQAIATRYLGPGAGKGVQALARVVD